MGLVCSMQSFRDSVVLPSYSISETELFPSRQQMRKERDSMKRHICSQVPHAQSDKSLPLMWPHLDAKEAGKYGLAVYPGRENRCSEHLASLAILVFPYSSSFQNVIPAASVSPENMLEMQILRSHLHNQKLWVILVTLMDVHVREPLTYPVRHSSVVSTLATH